MLGLLHVGDVTALDAPAFALAGTKHVELTVGGLPRNQCADLPRPDVERGDDLFDARRRHIIPRSPNWQPGLRQRRARRSASRAPPAPRAAGVARNGSDRACRSAICRARADGWRRPYARIWQVDRKSTRMNSSP